ncbi:unnamed protein product [Sphacelaria rigidula]
MYTRVSKTSLCVNSTVVRLVASKRTLGRGENVAGNFSKCSEFLSSKGDVKNGFDTNDPAPTIIATRAIRVMDMYH